MISAHIGNSCGISKGKIISVNWLLCYRFFEGQRPFWISISHFKLNFLEWWTRPSLRWNVDKFSSMRLVFEKHSYHILLLFIILLFQFIVDWSIVNYHCSWKMSAKEFNYCCMCFSFGWIGILFDFLLNTINCFLFWIYDEL